MSTPSFSTRLISIVIPLVVLIGVIGWLYINPPQGNLIPVAKTESLTIERVTLEPGRFALMVRNDGAETLSIAQVTINDAAWISLVLPKTTIEPLARANILLEDYEWIEDQPYQIIIYTTRANTFTIDIPQARATPRLTQPMLLTLSLNGLLVGLLPIYVGFSWWPLIRQLYLPSWIYGVGFVIAVLIWHSVDLSMLIPQIISKMPTIFQRWGLIMVGLIGSVAGYYWWYTQPEESETRLTFLRGYRLALAIGVFSFGEGIVLGYFVGGSRITAEPLWLRSPFWIVSLLLLNSSKGAILAFVFSEARPFLAQWILLGFIAGFPMLLGLLLGTFPLAQPLIAVSLGAFIGSTLWIMTEVLLLARDESEGEPLWRRIAIGIVIGLTVALLVNFVVFLI